MNTPNKDTRESFEFRYAAPTAEERREIEGIRSKYLPEDQRKNKFDKLKDLDRKAKRPASATAIAAGILGTLIFGLGLSMALEWNLVLGGSLVAVVGLLPIAAAYPLYHAINRIFKKRYAPEILKLSEELLNQEKGASESVSRD